ncbi:unnamed protein product [Urochloa humidicola]
MEMGRRKKESYPTSSRPCLDFAAAAPRSRSLAAGARTGARRGSCNRPLSARSSAPFASNPAARRRREPEWRRSTTLIRFGRGKQRRKSTAPLASPAAGDPTEPLLPRAASAAAAPARGGASAVVGLPSPYRLHAVSSPAGRRGREEGRAPATASSGSGDARAALKEVRTALENLLRHRRCCCPSWPRSRAPSKRKKRLHPYPPTNGRGATGGTPRAAAQSARPSSSLGRRHHLPPPDRAAVRLASRGGGVASSGAPEPLLLLCANRRIHPYPAAACAASNR